jgi:uncharacterized membrane protein YcgQ (UPF0703/DUF1980 family)
MEHANRGRKLISRRLAEALRLMRNQSRSGRVQCAMNCDSVSASASGHRSPKMLTLSIALSMGKATRNDHMKSQTQAVISHTRSGKKFKIRAKKKTKDRAVQRR